MEGMEGIQKMTYNPPKYRIGDRVRLTWDCYKGTTAEYQKIDGLSLHEGQWSYHIGDSRFGEDALELDLTLEVDSHLVCLAGKMVILPDVARKFERELIKYRKQVAELKKALQFYADGNHIEHEIINGIGLSCFEGGEDGTIARKALENEI